MNWGSFNITCLWLWECLWHGALCYRWQTCTTSSTTRGHSTWSRSSSTFMSASTTTSPRIGDVINSYSHMRFVIRTQIIIIMSKDNLYNPSVYTGTTLLKCMNNYEHTLYNKQEMCYNIMIAPCCILHHNACSLSYLGYTAVTMTPRVDGQPRQSSITCWRHWPSSLPL